MLLQVVQNGFVENYPSGFTLCPSPHIPLLMQLQPYKDNLFFLAFALIIVFSIWMISRITAREAAITRAHELTKKAMEEPPPLSMKTYTVTLRDSETPVTFQAANAIIEDGFFWLTDEDGCDVAMLPIESVLKFTTN